MNIIYEILIIIPIALGWIGYATLLCFRDEHHFIRSEGIENKNYILKKSKFLFITAFGITWNWKTGIIRKYTFWGLLGIYLYFFCFFVGDLVFYLITASNMIIIEPIVYVILTVLVPLIVISLCGITKELVRARKNR